MFVRIHRPLVITHLVVLSVKIRITHSSFMHYNATCKIFVCCSFELVFLWAFKDYWNERKCLEVFAGLRLTLPRLSALELSALGQLHFSDS